MKTKEKEENPKCREGRGRGLEEEISYDSERQSSVPNITSSVLPPEQAALAFFLSLSLSLSIYPHVSIISRSFTDTSYIKWLESHKVKYTCMCSFGNPVKGLSPTHREEECPYKQRERKFRQVKEEPHKRK